ncbi:Calx-beta domain-containing protein [Dankookia sp. GCM10030260]|uniref:Calx-beta domain-containing protein n=1 Tax=Dankookia sp. GCM10030260 TaxID=3273390 RepID=UPI003610B1C2
MTILLLPMSTFIRTVVRHLKAIFNSTSLSLTISLDAPSSAAQTVQWQVNGTGTIPAIAADFLRGSFPSGTVTFAPGETSQMITVSVAGDTAVESDEAIRVTLLTPSSGLVLGTKTATTIVLNDDIISKISLYQVSLIRTCEPMSMLRWDSSKALAENSPVWLVATSRR